MCGLKRRCPQAKPVCIDIQPYATVQARNRADILNIGNFATQNGDDGYWVRSIEAIKLLREAA